MLKHEPTSQEHGKGGKLRVRNILQRSEVVT